MTETVDVDGSEATRFRCPPGTNNAGDWTNAMGTTCNLGPARQTISEISQGSRAVERLNKPSTGRADAAQPPSKPERRGVRERVAGLLDRFAERARPTEDRERRRTLQSPSRQPEGRTSGQLPERRRVQTEEPEAPKRPIGPSRAVSAATDDAKKRNVKNNGKKIVGMQFGQNFGKEDSAKDQAIESAKAFKTRVFIIKNDNAAARPYRVVDEDRARIAKNGTIVGVVDPNGKHRPLDTAGFTPNNAIDELDKNPDFGVPRGPNGPSGPKTSRPKISIPPPPERFPSVVRDLTAEEQELLEVNIREYIELIQMRKDAIDAYVDLGSIEDIDFEIKKLNADIEAVERLAANYLGRWRRGESDKALLYLEWDAALKEKRSLIAYAESAKERAALKKRNLQEAREEADRLRREEEARRAAEAVDVAPGEPKQPRTVGVGEIFGSDEPSQPEAPEPSTSTGVTGQDKVQIKANLEQDGVGYQDTLFDVTHGNEVVEGFFMPTEVPDGNAGISETDDAIQHLMNGGSLDDVPDIYLRNAILGATGLPEFGGRQGIPRFEIVASNPGGGLNAAMAPDIYSNTYIVRDLITGRKYIVKSPTAFQAEFVNELFGQYLQQALGLHTARIRVSGYDSTASGRRNLPFVMEHFDDVIVGGVEGDGEDLPPGEFQHFLKDTSFESPSKSLLLLMDEVLMNGDRHFKNWLFNGSGGDRTVLGIDNGAAGDFWYRPDAAQELTRLKVFLRNSSYSSDPAVEQRVQQVLGRIDTEQALRALNELTERIAGTDGLAKRHFMASEIIPIARERMDRIKVFLSALKELQDAGEFNV